MKVNLPAIISVQDYHEFKYLEKYFKEIIPGIQVEELGLLDKEYIGIAFIIKDKNYKALIKNIQEDN